MEQHLGTASHRRLEDEFYKVMKLFNNTQWREFARSRARGLSLTDYQIDDIRADYIHDVKEQKYQMLSLWQRKNGQRATVERLYELANNFLQMGLHAQPTTTLAPVTHDVEHRAPVDNDNSVTDAMREQPEHSDAALEPMNTNPESVNSIVVHDDASMQRAYSSYQNVNRETFTASGGPQENHEGNGPNQTSNQGASNFVASLEVPNDPSIPTRAIATFGQSTGLSNPDSYSTTDRSYVQLNSTLPKQTGVRTTNRVHTTEYANSSNKAVPTVGRNFRGLGGIGAIMNNVQINVLGKNAIGVQTNYYYGGKKIKKNRLKPSNSPKVAEYCNAVREINFKQSEEELYDDHLEHQDDIYKISHKPKGAVVIINNSFHGQTDERHGSDKDLQNMELMWDKLGCKVIVKTEQTAEECEKTFENFTKSSVAISSDFVAVVIMSHGDEQGGEDIFYGSDKKSIKVKNVLEIFNNKNAKRLQGIPKLFFFQFCRGTNVDMGTEHMERVEVPAESFFNSLDNTIRRSSGVPSSGDASDSRGIQTSKKPTMSDTMISFATQSGFKAFRNQRDGSWYINAIINVFMNYAHDQHLVELMTKVNNAIESKTAVNSEDPTVHEGKEMSDFTSTLTKKLFFFPGFPEELEGDFV